MTPILYAKRRRLRFHGIPELFRCAAPLTIAKPRTDFSRTGYPDKSPHGPLPAPSVFLNDQASEHATFRSGPRRKIEHPGLRALLKCAVTCSSVEASLEAKVESRLS
jgi:hypothetical protein